MITLTSNQLLNLRDTPVKLINAPGSGYVSMPFLIMLKSNAGNVGYGVLTTGFGLIANDITLFPSQIISTNFLSSTNDRIVYYVFTNDNDDIGINVSDIENQDIYIKNTGLLELTSGNGTLDIEIYWNTFAV